MFKKLISAGLTLLLAVGLMSMCVFAEDREPDYTDSAIPTLMYDHGDNANMTFQTDSMGTSTAVGLKPLDAASAEGAWFEYDFDVPANCSKIDIVLSYAASGERFMELTFNGETRRLSCPDTGSWSTFSEVTETFESVDAGTYVVRIAAPADFDNDTVKTPNVDLITLNMYLAEGETLQAEETDVETDPPATDAPGTDEETNAPENNGAGTQASANDGDAEGGCGSVMSASAIALTVTSVLGCAAVGRRRRS